MRLERFVLLVVIGMVVGCGDGYTVPAGGSAPSSDASAADAEAEAPSKAETFWELLDETDLKVAIDPAAPAADTEVTLRAERLAGSGFHRPLKSLHYRVVSEQNAEAEWLPMPAPQRTELEGGMVKSVYQTPIRLPKGASFIQFQVDQGFDEPFTLTDWSVRAE